MFFLTPARLTAPKAPRRLPRAALLAAAMVLSACAPRAEWSLMNPSAPGADSGGAQFEVLAVTTRARLAPDANIFTAARSAVPGHALFAIAAAPGRASGQIMPPALVVERQAILTSRAALLDRLAARPDMTDVGLFVHGYNMNFPESLLRTAQLAADDVLPGAPVLFAWPSEARMQGYLHDRDSVTASRDALADLLTDLARDRRLGRIDVLAHSMGAWLTVEALRQLRLAGRTDVLGQLSVTLAAPDIDVDVFAAQMAVIGPMRQPMKILVAPDDRALILSSRISGERVRLGMMDVADPRVGRIAAAYNIAVIDISEMQATDGLRHDRYAGLGSAASPRTQVNDLRRAGAYVVTAVGGLVAAPFDVLEGALSPD
ncbi:alpha/beta hydrolase [Paracoccus sp. (in: a-proteobacteria)]|uniref:alpha/beta hydrolase n=1 Tax=Paracoccus sp. TaxID=267 RepID=UPI00272D7812|nr:alpha/beta hydrolase [Paracoccus sp. (in: a-proteobacteria)]